MFTEVSRPSKECQADHNTTMAGASQVETAHVKVANTRRKFVASDLNNLVRESQSPRGAFLGSSVLA